jgi:hypothetical protein
MRDRIIFTRTCPRCQTEIKLFMLPEGTMTDPMSAKARFSWLNLAQIVARESSFGWAGNKC